MATFDPTLEVIFTNVDKSLSSKFLRRQNVSVREMDSETLVIIRNFVNDNLTAIAVDRGNYFVMFNSTRGSEGDWLDTSITETMADDGYAAYRRSVSPEATNRTVTPQVNDQPFTGAAPLVNTAPQENNPIPPTTAPQGPSDSTRSRYDAANQAWKNQTNQ
jgi:hypothetical protein